jgi:Family of unknown function (DUF6510)
MTDSGLMLDGNALAGALREVFVQEMTSARISCDGCGRVEAIGAEHAYTQAPGIVLRCRHCADVLLVMTRRKGSYLLGFPRSRWLEVLDAP